MQLALSMEFESLALRFKPICVQSQVGFLFRFTQNDTLSAWSELACGLKNRQLRGLKKLVSGLIVPIVTFSKETIAPRSNRMAALEPKQDDRSRYYRNLGYVTTKSRQQP